MPTGSGHHCYCWKLPKTNRSGNPRYFSLMCWHSCPTNLASVTLRDCISISFQHLWALPCGHGTSCSVSVASRTTCPSWVLLFLYPCGCRNTPLGSEQKVFCHLLTALGQHSDPLHQLPRQTSGGKMPTASWTGCFPALKAAKDLGNTKHQSGQKELIVLPVVSSGPCLWCSQTSSALSVMFFMIFFCPALPKIR